MNHKRTPDVLAQPEHIVEWLPNSTKPDQYFTSHFSPSSHPFLTSQQKPGCEHYTSGPPFLPELHFNRTVNTLPTLLLDSQPGRFNRMTTAQCHRIWFLILQFMHLLLPMDFCCRFSIMDIAFKNTCKTRRKTLKRTGVLFPEPIWCTYIQADKTLINIK